MAYIKFFTSVNGDDILYKDIEVRIQIEQNVAGKIEAKILRAAKNVDKQL